jgi:hypothetical protein
MMIQRVLSFDDSPPLSGPLRFFLAAPLYGLAAAAGLAWYGEAALVSRWSLPTLALVHLLTLGYLTMAMCGALLQILPVVAGVTVRGARLTPWLVFSTLAAGALLLAGGFAFASPLLFQCAALALGLSLAWFLAAAAPGLVRIAPGGAAATMSAVRLALACLALTATLGLALAASFTWPLGLPISRLTDLHAAWGLLGWVGLLVSGVAFQVIPMFQATPAYPSLVAKRLPTALALALVAWSFAPLVPARMAILSADAALAALLAALLAGFAVVTLRLLSKRKRAAPDATTLFWRLAMASLLAASCLAFFRWPGYEATRPLLLGVLLITGFGCSAVSGMLYKIVPFLLWYQLQSNDGADRRAMPNLRSLLPDQSGKRQFHIHLAAVPMLGAAAFLPHLLARPAAVVFGASCLCLWINLVRACLLYRRTVRGFTPAPPCGRQRSPASVSSDAPDAEK